MPGDPKFEARLFRVSLTVLAVAAVVAVTSVALLVKNR